MPDSESIPRDETLNWADAIKAGGEILEQIQRTSTRTALGYWLRQLYELKRLQVAAKGKLKMRLVDLYQQGVEGRLGLFTRWDTAATAAFGDVRRLLELFTASDTQELGEFIEASRPFVEMAVQSRSEADRIISTVQDRLLGGGPEIIDVSGNGEGGQ